MPGVHDAAGFTAAFLASLVEAIEALTVVMAVGVTRGWRNALAGTAGGLLVLAGLIAALGPAAPLPNQAIRLVVGVLTLLFGLRWLRKAILRAAGRLPLRDEDAAFARATARLGGGPQHAGWDGVALAAAFQVVVMEGVEVVFIVAAVAAGGAGRAAAQWGAAAALAVVVALGLALHRPIARVPENTLKFAVGCMLCGFGSFWTGEGLGLDWPEEAWALPGLGVFWAAAALGLVALARLARQPA